MGRSLLTYCLMTLALLIALGAYPAVLLAEAAPTDAGIVLVIAPPWNGTGGAAGIVHAMGGDPIGPSQAPFATLAVLDNPAEARSFGAWAVFDGSILARLCGFEH